MSRSYGTALTYFYYLTDFYHVAADILDFCRRCRLTQCYPYGKPFLYINGKKEEEIRRPGNDDCTF